MQTVRIALYPAVFFLTLWLSGCTWLATNESNVQAVEVSRATANSSTGTPSKTQAQSEPPSPAAQWEPEQVVDLFLNGHINAPGGMLRNRGYARSPYLSKAFILFIDQIQASDENNSQDPFLFAQSSNVQITVEPFEVDEKRARVIAREHWLSGPLDLTVDLIVEDGRWVINNIQKGNPTTPEGVVWLYYNWYIEYYGQRDSPLAGQAYQASPYLSPAFIQRVDLLTSGRDPNVLDPFVLAREKPDWIYTYKPEVDGERATMNVEFTFRDTEKPNRMRKVFLTQSDGVWLIDNVSDLVGTSSLAASIPTASDTTGWDIFADEEFGFSFSYPSGWIVQNTEDAYRGDFEPGEPEIDSGPIKRQYYLMPDEIRVELESRTDQLTGYLAPGSGEDLSIPYLVTIVEGTRTEVDEIYVVASYTEEIVLNGHAALYYEPIGQQAVQYRFPHPYRSGLWVIFQDMLANNPRSEAQARAMTGLLDLILQGIEFVR
jgi:hypothetical protein